MNNMISGSKLLLTLFAMFASSSGMSAANQKNPPLEYENVKRIILERGLTRDGKPVSFIQVTFGDWLAGCETVKATAESKKDDAKCILTPASGKMANGIAQPLENGVRIEMTNIRQPQFEIYLATHQPKSDYQIKCGKTDFSSNNYRLRKFYLQEAAKFIEGLRETGCEMRFTPKDAGEKAEQPITRRGFGDVMLFAERFVDPGN